MGTMQRACHKQEGSKKDGTCAHAHIPVPVVCLCASRGLLVALGDRLQAAMRRLPPGAPVPRGLDAVFGAALRCAREAAADELMGQSSSSLQGYAKVGLGVCGIACTLGLEADVASVLIDTPKKATLLMRDPLSMVFAHPSQAVDLLLFLMTDVPAVAQAKPRLSPGDEPRVHKLYAAIKIRQSALMHSLNKKMLM